MECVFGAELGFRQRLCRVRGVAPTRIEQSHLMAAAELDSTRSLGLFVETSKDPTAAAMSVQAYAQIVDKTLTYDDLPALGAKLKFPSGWRYSTTVPQQDIVAAPREKRPRCRTISTTPIRSWIDLV
jgi:hypothetical protein